LESWKIFHQGAVCLVLSSAVFDEADYIRDYKDFKLFKTDEPKPELVKTVFRRINCFKIKKGSSSSVLFWSKFFKSMAS
jgi:hypothetical protein